MNRSIRNEVYEKHRRTILSIAFSIVMISITFVNLNAFAASATPSDYRLAVAGDKFSDTWQIGVAFKLRPPRLLRAKHVELAIGSLSTSREFRLFVSLGPVWRWSSSNHFLHVDLNFSPTLISGSTFNGRNLGGNIHFTSAATIGTRFGRRDALAVSPRVQHISNGGLSRTNPGLDMIGLNINFNSSDR